MRSHSLSVLVLLTSAALLEARGSAAQSKNVDAERFKPAVTTDGWVNSEGSGVRGTADPWEFGAFLNYAVRPLVVVDASNNLTTKLVGGRLGVDLLASVTLADPFAIGLGLPFFLFQSGDNNPDSVGLGDLRLVPKLRILDDRKSVGLALALELRAPTHLGDYSGGTRNVVGIPKIILDHRFMSGLRLGANAGILLREKTSLANISAASEAVLAGDIGYRFGGHYGKTEIGAEINAAVGLTQQNKEEVPVEAFGYLRQALGEDWELMVGPGVGLNPGYGVPLFRVFVGIRGRPTTHDADHDGIEDSKDKCPNDKEDFDRFEDDDGCPEEGPDSDKDGIPDDKDKCPDQKETINGFEDEDGCPDSGNKQVIFEEGKFKIVGTVQFEHGSAQIKEESHSLLDQVALTMKANPQVENIRVEGHTDDTGPHDLNMRLSQERADSVRRYLISKGVSPKRLKAKGFGPDKPLINEKTPEARTKNRRVEFVVE